MIGATYSADSTLAGNAPSATVKELIEYLMCGTYAVKAQPPSTSASSDTVESTVANHCWNAFHPSEPSSSSFSAGPRNYPKILACTSGAAAPTNIESDTCAPVAEVTLDVWLARPDVQQVVGKGFLFHVATLLHSVVQKMKSGSPISDDEKKFIQAAPFPLYRLLNLASLFPAVELDLVDTNSVLIAYMMSHEMINQQLRSGQRRSVAFRAASPKIISTLNEMTKSIQGGNDKFITELDENLRRSRLFTDKIERLHQDMLRVVYDKQLKSNYMAATDLSRLTTPSYR